MKKIIFLMIAAAFMAAGSVWAQQNDQAKASQKSPATLTVQGNCGMCTSRIEKAAKKVDGVNFAKWDSKKKQLQVNFDDTKTSVGDISKAIAKAGYDTEADKADDATYKSLPMCCQYRQ